MGMKQQAVNKQNTNNSIRDQITALHIVESIKNNALTVEQAYEESIIGKIGFIQVVPTKLKQEDKLAMVNVVGMLVMAGYEARGVQGYRRLKINAASPRWFREAVMKELDNPTGMYFRVSISGLSNTGKVAFVHPRAKSFDNAINEDKRYRLDQERALNRTEFHGDNEIARKAYEMYAAQNSLIIDRNYSQGNDSVIMLSRGALPTVYLVSGGNEISNFIHGINKGYTSWAQEIEKNIVAVKLDPFYNNLKKALTNA